MKRILFLLMTIFLLLISCNKEKDYNEVIRVSIGSEPQSIDPSLLSALDSMIYAGMCLRVLLPKMRMEI